MSLKFEPKCKVCTSPHRLYYEKQRALGKSIKEIWEMSKKLGENIHYNSFARHFQKHFDLDLVKQTLGIQTTTNVKISEQINILEEIEKNLEIARRLVNKLLEMMPNEPDLDSVKALTALLGEIRMTLTTANKLRESLVSSTTETEEEWTRKFVSILKQLKIDENQVIEAFKLLGVPYES